MTMERPVDKRPRVCGAMSEFPHVSLACSPPRVLGALIERAIIKELVPTVISIGRTFELAPTAVLCWFVIRACCFLRIVGCRLVIGCRSIFRVVDGGWH